MAAAAPAGASSAAGRPAAAPQLGHSPPPRRQLTPGAPGPDAAGEQWPQTRHQPQQRAALAGPGRRRVSPPRPEQGSLEPPAAGGNDDWASPLAQWAARTRSAPRVAQQGAAPPAPQSGPLFTSPPPPTRPGPVSPRWGGLFAGGSSPLARPPPLAHRSSPRPTPLPGQPLQEVTAALGLPTRRARLSPPHRPSSPERVESPCRPAGSAAGPAAPPAEAPHRGSGSPGRRSCSQRPAGDPAASWGPPLGGAAAAFAWAPPSDGRGRPWGQWARPPGPPAAAAVSALLGGANRAILRRRYETLRAHCAARKARRTGSPRWRRGAAEAAGPSGVEDEEDPQQVCADCAEQWAARRQAAAAAAAAMQLGERGQRAAVVHAEEAGRSRLRSALEHGCWALSVAELKASGGGAVPAPGAEVAARRCAARLRRAAAPPRHDAHPLGDGGDEDDSRLLGPEPPLPRGPPEGPATRGEERAAALGALAAAQLSAREREAEAVCAVLERELQRVLDERADAERRRGRSAAQREQELAAAAETALKRAAALEADTAELTAELHRARAAAEERAARRRRRAHAAASGAVAVQRGALQRRWWALRLHAAERRAARAELAARQQGAAAEAGAVQAAQRERAAAEARAAQAAQDERAAQQRLWAAHFDRMVAAVRQRVDTADATRRGAPQESSGYPAAASADVPARSLVPQPAPCGAAEQAAQAALSGVLAELARVDAAHSAVREGLERQLSAEHAAAREQGRQLRELQAADATRRQQLDDAAGRLSEAAAEHHARQQQLQGELRQLGERLRNAEAERDALQRRLEGERRDWQQQRRDSDAAAQQALARKAAAAADEALAREQAADARMQLELSKRDSQLGEALSETQRATVALAAERTRSAGALQRARELEEHRADRDRQMRDQRYNRAARVSKALLGPQRLLQLRYYGRLLRWALAVRGERGLADERIMHARLMRDTEAEARFRLARRDEELAAEHRERLRAIADAHCTELAAREGCFSSERAELQRQAAAEQARAAEARRALEALAMHGAAEAEGRKQRRRERARRVGAQLAAPSRALQLSCWGRLRERAAARRLGREHLQGLNAERRRSATEADAVLAAHAADAAERRERRRRRAARAAQQCAAPSRSLQLRYWLLLRLAAQQRRLQRELREAAAAAQWELARRLAEAGTAEEQRVQQELDRERAAAEGLHSSRLAEERRRAADAAAEATEERRRAADAAAEAAAERGRADRATEQVAELRRQSLDAAGELAAERRRSLDAEQRALVEAAAARRAAADGAALADRMRHRAHAVAGALKAPERLAQLRAWERLRRHGMEGRCRRAAHSAALQARETEGERACAESVGIAVAAEREAAAREVAELRTECAAARAEAQAARALREGLDAGAGAREAELCAHISAKLAALLPPPPLALPPQPGQQQRERETGGSPISAPEGALSYLSDRPLSPLRSRSPGPSEGTPHGELGVAQQTVSRAAALIRQLRGALADAEGALRGRDSAVAALQEDVQRQRVELGWKAYRLRLMEQTAADAAPPAEAGEPPAAPPGRGQAPAARRPGSGRRSLSAPAGAPARRADGAGGRRATRLPTQRGPRPSPMGSLQGLSPLPAASAAAAAATGRLQESLRRLRRSASPSPPRRAPLPASAPSRAQPIRGLAVPRRDGAVRAAAPHRDSVGDAPTRQMSPPRPHHATARCGAASGAVPAGVWQPEGPGSGGDAAVWGRSDGGAGAVWRPHPSELSPAARPAAPSPSPGDSVPFSPPRGLGGGRAPGSGQWASPQHGTPPQGTAPPQHGSGLSPPAAAALPCRIPPQERAACPRAAAASPSPRPLQSRASAAGDSQGAPCGAPPAAGTLGAPPRPPKVSGGAAARPAAAQSRPPKIAEGAPPAPASDTRYRATLSPPRTLRGAALRFGDGGCE